jgi:hypothetical protein
VIGGSEIGGEGLEHLGQCFETAGRRGEGHNLEGRSESPEHARLVAGTGGVIDAMPIMFGRQSDDVPGYVSFISRLVDAVGIDHVSIGT